MLHIAARRGLCLSRAGRASISLHVTHMPSRAVAGRTNMVVARSAINAVGLRTRPLSTAGSQSSSHVIQRQTSDRGLCLGSHVEVDCEGRDEWSKAIITQVHADGSMTVQINKKEGEARVAASRVRPAGPEWEVRDGSVVEIDLDGDGTLPLVLKGVVVRLDRFNGTCDVVLHNGQRKEKVALCDLKKPGYDNEAIKRRIEQQWERPHLQEALRKLNLTLFEDQGTPGTERPGAAVLSGTCAIGQRVEARFKNGKVWYPGTVSRVHADGSLDVAYDDGDHEAHVKPDNVQPIAKDGAGRNVRVQAGAMVEVRSGCGSRWYPALIWARYDDGRVKLTYFKTRVVRPDKVRVTGAPGHRRQEGSSEPPQEPSSSVSQALGEIIDKYRAATPKQRRVLLYRDLSQVGYIYIYCQGLIVVFEPSIMALLEALSAMWGS